MGNLSTTALSRTILSFTTILISENIEQRSYVCVYLSVYFSKLNPLNNFDRRVKANLKEKCFFLQEETLLSRIGDVCNKNPFE